MIPLERPQDAIHFPSFQTRILQILGFLNRWPRATVWSGSKENVKKDFNKRNKILSRFHTLRFHFQFYLIKIFLLVHEKFQSERDSVAFCRSFSWWQSWDLNHVSRVALIYSSVTLHPTLLIPLSIPLASTYSLLKIIPFSYLHLGLYSCV